MRYIQLRIFENNKINKELQKDEQLNVKKGTQIEERDIGNEGIIGKA